MLIKFFSNGKGAGVGPVGYLVAREVLAYDANRDLIRDADGRPVMVARDPLPEVLRGDPARTEALIDASRNQWTYRAGVISFASEDAPTEGQQAQVMDAFERLAFAGMDDEQFDMLWVRHSHEDRVELHFCTPRLELTTGKSLNIAPPGYQTAYDSLRDLMNKTHGWADPMDLDRAQEVQATVEAPTRVQGREELHEWILDQISVGTISDRASMIDALTDAGFDIPRASKNYITAKDPDMGERWRLKGEIFHDDWQADPSSREIERGPGSDPQRARRLDGITIAELQERYSGQCEARAGYNRDRYQHVSGLERESLAGPYQHGQAFDAGFTLDGELGVPVDGGRDTGIDPLLELAVVGDDEPHAVGDAGLTDSAARGRDLSDPAAGNSEHSQLHDGGPDGFLHQSGGELDGSAPDSLGTRFAGLRRAIGGGLRNLSTGIARLRGALDGRDREEAEWVGTMRAAAHEITSLVRENIGRLADRGRDLRDAGRELTSQLEASESRRETAERELNERQFERGQSHGLGL